MSACRPGHYEALAGPGERSSVQTELGLRLPAVWSDTEPSDHQPGLGQEGTLCEVCDWGDGRSFRNENEFVSLNFSPFLGKSLVIKNQVICNIKRGTFIREKHPLFGSFT